MTSRLLWTENKVEAVWRRVNRKLENPEIAEKAKQKLLTHQSFPTASLEEASEESIS